MQSKITQSLVERAPPPVAARPTLYADTEMRGFYLIVSRTKRSFYVQSLVNGRQVRTKLGDHPAMDAKQARDLARKALVEMRSGTNPNEERRKAKARGITLREGLDLHLNSRRLADKTRSGYEYHVTYYLNDWLDKPLAEIGADRQGVRERHRRITEKSGATSGDNTMRVLRSVYNRALRQFPDLPPNPVGNVDMNGMRRREVDASPDKLRAWGKAVLSLGNPVRRDLQLFMLLSGMRRTASCEARCADLADGRLHVPNPKGGSAKKFDLPLSSALADLLAHREAEADRVRRKTPYLFPADSASGRVAEVQQHELGDLTGHALRHAYASLALQSGVPLLELRFLLNHSASSGGVTMGYLHPSLDHLREHQERASAYILDALGMVHEPGSWPPRLKE
ncbi:integrase arm-type DNA-binding domain-containing protein [Xanthomonas cucurbitae]|uniref:Site-specific integrase n=1 Tax=Xanthomonas cucurbitae TaxID=56453 RepID=A0ABY7YD73_9XANT|nr:integrase arm-type DNA-binding domain-containing protein [Xanthomonas cucurbitae]WDM67925.1 site-specific integrase [Xanthomonas cucurbitae]WDM71799.1 site-specific integrase [Xanthomonas cucurbitae]